MGMIKTAIIAGVGIYAVKKMSKSNQNPRTNPAPGPTQDRDFHQQYFDEPPYYSPGDPYQDEKRAYHQQQHPPPQENVVPLEFTEPRGGRRRQQQQEDRHPQVLTTSNSAYSPLPHGYNHQDHYGHVHGYDTTAQNASESTSNLYAYPDNASPPHYDNRRQRRQQQQQQHHGFVEPDEVSDPTFDAPRRGENGKRTGFLDTLAHQAMSIKDGKGKDLVGKLLAR
ncbi:hypothetical protein Z517_01639 [Fonsecaea pedrosoi CBS 271.37]|uniref:Uncharacterized protein n=1 Tax=Fonsecaea pedrosoi CBS 271.37 TaxID=1442368 RepID=A0A0D2HP58_9EURO|nr:uncharacterized protein Z517_01639 [Fonsecaea pedrosoi CBS 271.37]KIW86244.1 hypothetical protein Z517_01639 [Fonsecaea pedrosoi CBS 271.37]